MSQNPVIDELEAKLKRTDITPFVVGDTVNVHTLIKEGQKERVQIFTGIVIAKDGGGLSETFSVYRNAYGSCMEKVFLLHSPRIEKIVVVRSGKVRRAKLYYLRGASGKAVKLKEKIRPKTVKGPAVKAVAEQLPE